MLPWRAASRLRPFRALGVEASLTTTLQRGFAAAAALVVAERGAGVQQATLSALTAARQLGAQQLHVLVLGPSRDALEAHARALARVDGVHKVLAAGHPSLEHDLPEPAAALLVRLQQQRQYSHIVAAASSASRGTLPRAAALLGAPMVAEVLRVGDASTFTRPIYAGRAHATVRADGPAPRVLTVRATAFAPAAPRAAAGAADADVEDVSADAAAAAEALPPGCRATWVSSEGRPEGAGRADLSTARVVVAGGRGMQSEEGLRLLGRLADALGGALGASRAVVDGGLAPNELQVGQTGKSVAPDVYVAVGISGAIQHMAGVADAKRIVAVNKDPEAPICAMADAVLVADGYEVVPALLEALEGGGKTGAAGAER